MEAELEKRLKEPLSSDVIIESHSDLIVIQAGNMYEACIATDFGNKLSL